MTCQVSIIIPSFLKSNVLKWGLFSLARQDIPYDFETIVLNDGIHDETETICKEYEQKLNLKYIFTGQRNLNGELRFRGPGFAINIGAKLSCGEILIICNPEMFHLNDTITQLAYPLLNDKKLIAVPVGMKDHNGSFLNYLEKHNGDFDRNSFYLEYLPINTHLPYLMSIHRDEFFTIGGYDEDFVGIASEDGDIMYRLLDNGCSYFQTHAKTIHLFHIGLYGPDLENRKKINIKLYGERRGQIIRNQNKEWGKLEEEKPQPPIVRRKRLTNNPQPK